MTADVSIQSATHRFGDFNALTDINLEIDAGSFAVLLGPSGCGKTTLLSLLGGFLTPTEGRILIGGKDVTGVPPAKRPTTTMFQDYALFPHMTLEENVGFGLRMRGQRARVRRERAHEMLALVGLSGAERKKPHELSGGQRQRVALARALCVDPDVLLLDEPLGALDLKLRRQMQDELKSIQRRVGTTFVHVTHDQEEAMAIADTIVVMREGRIQHAGPPEEVYLRPVNPFTASFMGETNFLDAEIIERAGNEVRLSSACGPMTVPSHLTPGAKRHVRLSFRPEHVDPGLAGPGTVELGKGMVTDVAFFGTHHRAQISHDDDAAPWSIHLAQDAEISSGTEISVRVKAEHLVIFAADE